jgi:hypothetical protein
MPALIDVLHSCDQLSGSSRCDTRQSVKTGHRDIGINEGGFGADEANAAHRICEVAAAKRPGEYFCSAVAYVGRSDEPVAAISPNRAMPIRCNTGQRTTAFNQVHSLCSMPSGGPAMQGMALKYS